MATPVTPDQGVLKEVLVAAPADAGSPEAGDEVRVHYTGRLLDGTVFDSSVERGTPFTFKLGKGEVIKGWDVGVATMRKGEKAYLTCSPDYAYGKNGSPPKIPADATLVFEVELLGWKSQNDLTGDGGVVKKTLRATTDAAATQPATGNDVTVHYTISLASGQEVFSTRANGGAPVQLTVGAASVPAALNKVLTTIKVGDLVRVNATAAYAFGAAGSTAHHVEPNTDVVFEVELLECIKTADLLRDEPGKLTKRILKQNPNEFKKPSDRATVHVVLEIRKVGDATPLLHHATATAVKLNTGELPEAADLLIASMTKAEVAEVTAAAADFGYGTEENARRGLTGGAQLHIRAELVDIEKERDSWDLTVPEKLERSLQYKEIGNTYFKTQQFRRAQRQYKEAIEFFRYDSSLTDEEKKKANEVKLPSHLNLAACALKNKDYKTAKENCDKALAIDGNNVKALFRRAQALVGQLEHELAQRDLAAAAKLDPANKDVRDLIAKIKEDLKAQTKREKELFAGKLFKKPLFDHEQLAKSSAKKPSAVDDMDSDDEAETAKPAEPAPAAAASDEPAAPMQVDASTA